MPFSIPTLYLVNAMSKPSVSSFKRASRLSYCWTARYITYSVMLTGLGLTRPDNYAIQKQNIFLLPEYTQFT